MTTTAVGSLLLTNMRPRVQVVHGVPMTTSLAIAEHFEKRHDHVLRAIREKIEAAADMSFSAANFQETLHINERGQSQPIFRLTELGFSMMVMGFTGRKAMRWQRAYVEAFMAMRQALAEGPQDHLVAGRAQDRAEIAALRKTIQTLQVSERDWRQHAGDLERELRQQRHNAEHYEKAAAVAHERYCVEFHRAQGLQVEKALADELIGEGHTPSTDLIREQYLVLKDAVSEKIQKHAAEVRQLRAHLDLEKRQRITADPSISGVYETLVRLQFASGKNLSDACVLWALMQHNAIVEDIALPQELKVYRRNEPAHNHHHRGITVEQVYSATSKSVSKAAILEAGHRLADAGLIELKRLKGGKDKRERYHFRLHLIKTVELLVSRRQDVDWITNQAAHRASYNGMGLALPKNMADLPPIPFWLDPLASPADRRWDNYKLAINPAADELDDDESSRPKLH